MQRLCESARISYGMKKQTSVRNKTTQHHRSVDEAIYTHERNQNQRCKNGLLTPYFGTFVPLLGQVLSVDRTQEPRFRVFDHPRNHVALLEEVAEEGRTSLSRSHVLGGGLGERPLDRLAN